MTKRKPITITDSLGRERSATRSSWGKVRQLTGGSGRFHASFVHNGTRYNAPDTFNLKSQAQDWLAEQRTATRNANWSPSSPADVREAQVERARTLGDYAARWLTERQNARGDHLRPRTLDEYRRLLAGPLEPLAGAPVSSLTAAKVRTWRAGQMATGRKTQTSRAYGLLNAIMRTALEDRLIAENPCTIKGGQSTHTGRKVEPPTDAELDTILTAITPRYRALVAIASGAGLRYGEATALRAKHVSIERDEHGNVIAALLTVEGGAVRVAGGIVAGPPKTEAGVREVAVVEGAEVVAEHVHGLIGDALLFPARDGVSYLSQSAFWKHWNPARVAAGRPDMPFHALRHYHGTRFAQSGATQRDLMDEMGHADPRTTARYQHSSVARRRELAARMAKRSS